MMSVRHSLLALLERRPMYGYGLKGEFEAATGHKVYRLAEAGRRELDGWFLGPLVRDAVPRQELALKLVFAVRSPSVDVHRVIQRQRAAKTSLRASSCLGTASRTSGPRNQPSSSRRPASASR